MYNGFAIGFWSYGRAQRGVTGSGGGYRTSLPTVDINGICRSAQAAALPEERSRAFDSWLNQEQAAPNQLKQKWTRYSRVAHENCAEFGGMSLSYVELLACLQMQSGGDLGAGHFRQRSAAPAPKTPKRLMAPSGNP